MNKYISLALVGVIALVSFSSLASADNDNRRTISGSGSGLTSTQLTCIRTAVSTRESTVRTIYAALSAAYLAGMDARAQSLDAAWTIADKTARKTARDAAWSTWNTSAKTARETFRAARKAAWDTFRTSTKACRVNPSEVESSMTQASDVQ